MFHPRCRHIPKTARRRGLSVGSASDVGAMSLIVRPVNNRNTKAGLPEFATQKLKKRREEPKSKIEKEEMVVCSLCGLETPISLAMKHTTHDN